MASTLAGWRELAYGIIDGGIGKIAENEPIWLVMIGKIDVLFLARAELAGGFVSPVHSHDSWQADFLLKGAAAMKCGREEFVLDRPGVFLIPPGLVHHFRYRRKSRLCSFRFCVIPASLAAGPACALAESAVAPGLFSSVCAFLGADHHLLGLKKVFFEHVLAAVIAMRDAANASTVVARHPALRRAMDYVDMHSGRQLSVTAVAKAADCTPGHLAALFRMHTGRSLKAYLDAQRALFIQRHLLYSDLSLRQIADLADFADLGTFSRFCRRLSGRSPGLLRKAQR